MTSSSDTEFHRRRIFVDGLPAKVTTAEVRSIFEPYGTVNFVHLSKNRGFVTFEDEESVVKALEMHGQSYKVILEMFKIFVKICFHSNISIFRTAL